MTTQTNNSEITISSTVNGVFSDAGAVLPMHTDAENRFSFNGIDGLIREINGAVEYIESAEFKTDEDRKALDKAKALANKVVPTYKKMLKAEQARVFAPAQEQIENLNDALVELTTALKTRGDYFERIYREEKDRMIRDQVAERIRYVPAYEGHVTADALISSRWMNRTVRESEVVREIDERFAAIDALTTIAGDIDVAVSHLVRAGWDMVRATTDYTSAREAEQKAERDRIEAERQAKIVAAHDAEEKARKEAEEAERAASVRQSSAANKAPVRRTVTVSVTVNESDLPELTDFVERTLGGSVQ